MAARRQPLLGSAPPWLDSVLRCPRCKGALSQTAGLAQCMSPACALDGFPSAANGHPILIDFEKSVISKETAVRPTAPGDRRLRVLGNMLTRLRSITTNVSWKSNFRAVAELLSATQSPRVLLVGGGEGGVAIESLIQLVPGAEIVNSDVYSGRNVHVLADAHQLPFADETFDLAVVDAVLEHVLDPAQAVAEIWRCLKPRGIVYADTPFLLAVHMGPHDFTRFSPLGHRALFRNFEEVRRGVSVGPMSVVRWSVEHAARSIFRSRRAGWFFRPLTLPLSWLDRFASASPFALDACGGSYFIGRKSQRSLTPGEIIEAYRGGQQ